MNDEIPAIRQRGEKVIPRGGSDTPQISVNVNNRAAPFAKVQEPRISTVGARSVINVMVESALSEAGQSGRLKPLLQSGRGVRRS